MPTETHQGPGRGRPREFDVDDVIAKAVAVFQEKGFHGASIGDLAAGTGLSVGSLYKAFGDKETILLRAFESHNLARVEQLETFIARGESGRDMVARTLLLYAELGSLIQGRKGCLVVSTMVEITLFSPAVQDSVARCAARIAQVLTEMVRRGKADGSLDPDLDETAAVRFLQCLLQGMRVYGKTGPTLEAMQGLVSLALRALV